ADPSAAPAALAQARLPDPVPAAGIDPVVRRRFKQVPAHALGPLETAAVIGRVIDPLLMGAVHPELALDAWIAECAGAAVLELRDQQWRFGHDKLREQLLRDLSAVRRRTLHQQVAEAIERGPVAGAGQVATLAHHWHEAGQPEREGEYAHRAGIQALQMGACREAIAFLDRAREILQVRAADAAGRPVRVRRWSFRDP